MVTVDKIDKEELEQVSAEQTPSVGSKAARMSRSRLS